mmetsp:Transcript_15142/g.22525  ORF Transcript_15142/g.22525 Transcript_15142/m.22525 type:complete len:266 (-) Transcript_15142:230-1027(-)
MGGDYINNDYLNLGKYMIGIIAVIIGLFSLLYSYHKRHRLMKKYLYSGVHITGTVLSCEDKKTFTNTKRRRFFMTTDDDDDEFEISVLYTAKEHKYNDTRNRFRYPNTFVEKRFMRRFVISERMVRGNKVDIVLLPGIPKSGMLSNAVYNEVENFSYCRSVLTLVPGMGLFGILLYKLQEQVLLLYNEEHKRRNVLVVIGVAIMLVWTMCMCYCSRIFQRKKRQLFSAVAMVQKTQDAQQYYGGGDDNNYLALEDPEIPYHVITK